MASKLVAGRNRMPITPLVARPIGRRDSFLAWKRTD